MKRKHNNEENLNLERKLIRVVGRQKTVVQMHCDKALDGD